MTHGRKPRKMRPLRDPFKHAQRHATALTATELSELRLPIDISLEALRLTEYDEQHVCMLQGVFLISQEIEASGIVRGLAEPIAHALHACAAVRTRAGANAQTPGDWNPVALVAGELNALRDMADLHMFQIKQLSAAELHRLTKRVASRIESQGGELHRVPLSNFTGVTFTEESQP